MTSRGAGWRSGAGLRGRRRVDQIERLNDLTPATGERHEEAQMSNIDR
jgi:hypothetical protein